MTHADKYNQLFIFCLDTFVIGTFYRSRCQGTHLFLSQVQKDEEPT